MGAGARNVYLDNVPLDEARRRWWEAVEAAGLRLEAEEVPVAGALGRVTAGPIFAARSAPHYHAAAMDGIAVRARDTYGASETTPVRLESETGYLPVDTGDPVPPGFDAVVMIEDVHFPGETAELLAPAGPWQHVRAVGEDIVATELVLPDRHRLRPADLGALLNAGLVTVGVLRRPRVALIPTGSEIIEPETLIHRPPHPGEIIESNTRVQAAMVIEAGGEPIRMAPVPDDRKALRAALRAAQAARADIIVINAGSSAGTEDFTSAVLAECGQVLVHGVAIRPGKPVVLGCADGRPVAGIPGYPVSAHLTFDLFVVPLIHRLLGQVPPARPVVRARLARKLASPAGLEEFVRVKVGRVGDTLIATPISRGAGISMSLVRSDGTIRIPRLVEGVGEGSTVEVELWRDERAVERTAVVVGSHDLTLELLGSVMGAAHPGFSLSSAHVGSLGGLVALRRGECHAAGTHLLDEESGDYNVSYVRRYVPGRRVRLVTLAHREQGLMVARGNPKAIKGFADLARPGVRFINRQRGAGTRVLLDYHLRLAGIAADTVEGYGREGYTHTEVAAAVAAGSADTALGIRAAATALDLDFVTVGQERYELAVLEDVAGEPVAERLLQAIGSAEFRRVLQGLPGYDARETGLVRVVEP
jgi:putative molybdopterin biosynthesis protein